MTETERRYGVWAGNPSGYPEDTAKCVEEVCSYESRWPTYRQCGRKRGHGADGLYCKQHAKKYSWVTRAQPDSDQGERP